MNVNDIGKSAAELAPPVIYYGVVKLFGLALPDWVALAALLYTVLQIVHLLWRWRRAARRGGDA